MPANEWDNTEHVDLYLGKADSFPRRDEGESALFEVVPRDAARILDLGTGNGRLLAMLFADGREFTGVGVDVSRPMLAAVRERFGDDPRVEVVEHDLAEQLPVLGSFDAIVSSMAIHHLEDERKRALFAEVFELLEPGGVFANFEHVASPTDRLHREFFEAIDEPLYHEDPSDRTALVETQLEWLREIGYEDVDCIWKWREMALLAGLKPASV